MPTLQRTQLVLVLILAAMSAGCGLSDVAWLPDSSGFVYTTSENNEQLSLFDLSTRKEQVLVKKTESSTLWPAVSPDGKQVATARVVREKDVPEKMQIIIYDLKGRKASLPRARLVRAAGDFEHRHGSNRPVLEPRGNSAGCL